MTMFQKTFAIVALLAAFPGAIESASGHKPVGRPPKNKTVPKGPAALAESKTNKVKKRQKTSSESDNFTMQPADDFNGYQSSSSSSSSYCSDVASSSSLSFSSSSLLPSAASFENAPSFAAASSSSVVSSLASLQPLPSTPPLLSMSSSPAAPVAYPSQFYPSQTQLMLYDTQRRLDEMAGLLHRISGQLLQRDQQAGSSMLDTSMQIMIEHVGKVIINSENTSKAILAHSATLKAVLDHLQLSDAEVKKDGIHMHAGQLGALEGRLLAQSRGQEVLIQGAQLGAFEARLLAQSKAHEVFIREQLGGLEARLTTQRQKSDVDNLNALKAQLAPLQSAITALTSKTKTPAETAFPTEVLGLLKAINTRLADWQGKGVPMTQLQDVGVPFDDLFSSQTLPNERAPSPLGSPSDATGSQGWGPMAHSSPPASQSSSSSSYPQYSDRRAHLGGPQQSAPNHSKHTPGILHFPQ